VTGGQRKRGLVDRGRRELQRLPDVVVHELRKVARDLVALDGVCAKWSGIRPG
jgi:hypothetical protein